MSIIDTYSELRAVVALTTSIRSLPTVFPTQLNDVDLPLALIIPGPGQEWNEHSLRLYRSLRTYIVRIYVKPVAQGLGIDEGATMVLPIIDSVGSYLVRNPTLNNSVDHIGQQGEFSDGGLAVLMYGDVPYHGVEFQIAITEKST